MSTTPQSFSSFHGLQPAWEIATLFPLQGTWTVDEYLDLTDSTNRLIEFTDGRIEVLEMPTIAHQRIFIHLLMIFKKFVDDHRLGEVLPAGLRVRVGETKFREPGIVFVRDNRRANVEGRYWGNADLAVEVVSDDENSRDRDLVKKRADYAAAGIAEYWIVDPAEKRITVLVLEGDRYATFGEFTPGQQAVSRLLEGFAVDVAATFQAAEA